VTKKQPKRSERPGVDRLGRTPLHYAANESREADVAQLLATGADANAKDDNGWTPLHFAAQAEALAITKLLLARNADVDAIDSNGNTPLFRAVFACTGNGALIELLREAGANPTLENHHGVSPVGLARDVGGVDIERFFSDLP
jgi:ankyrin repeat protein